VNRGNLNDAVMGRAHLFAHLRAVHFGGRQVHIIGRELMISSRAIANHVLSSTLMVLIHSPLARSQTSPLLAAPAESHVDVLRDGQHDFDFEIGIWKTHIKRLVHPLTGSNMWAEYDGTTVVRKVWNGRANLVELEVEGPAGRIEGLSLRLYNPDAHQWSLNFSNSRVGTLATPTVGGFSNGRGEFYDQETLNDRAIFVRFVISDITPTSTHFEQAYSSDGGKTWEVNWIATDTRRADESDRSH
jgi:hypothetical protein